MSLEQKYEEARKSGEVPDDILVIVHDALINHKGDEDEARNEVYNGLEFRITEARKAQDFFCGGVKHER